MDHAAYMRHRTTYRSACERRERFVGIYTLLHHRDMCSERFGDFDAAMLEVLQLGFHPGVDYVAAVRSAPINIGSIAVGAAVSGAIGASVALATASWRARKQDILLAN
eukprot:TRINITY_DN12803_c0_g1_i1.p1 TRINITY_DN12803_c0_g1~~TRINITY_DN12803_c0_g1_i1.p1  ORF type:complete len:108 (+),score=10.15 TRINITY_DN12803_c0_g1_i1:98-421(+)